MPFKLFFMPTFFIGLIFFSLTAKAEQSETFGDYTIHYIAVNTTFLEPKIAQQYDIPRSDRRAFLNVSILKNNPDGSSTPVTATLSGSKKNLLWQSQSIDFVKVTEGAAIYYIGHFEFSNAENVKLEIEVQPEHKGQTHSIQWNTKLYNN